MILLRTFSLVGLHTSHCSISRLLFGQVASVASLTDARVRLAAHATMVAFTRSHANVFHRYVIPSSAWQILLRQPISHSDLSK